eukprot:scaffold23141_cov78-Skeletonema_dohrnii-CCMP3373.AAC.1
MTIDDLPLPTFSRLTSLRTKLQSIITSMIVRLLLVMCMQNEFTAHAHAKFGVGGYEKEVKADGRHDRRTKH